MLVDLKKGYSSDVEDIFKEALAIVTVGRMFYFGFKFTHHIHNNKKVKVSIKDIISCNKDKINSSGLVALQMIPAYQENSTESNTVRSVLKMLLHQDMESLYKEQSPRIRRFDEQTKNNELSTKKEFCTISDYCTYHEESSSNQTELILSCESYSEKSNNNLNDSTEKPGSVSHHVYLHDQKTNHSCSFVDSSLPASVDRYCESVMLTSDLNWKDSDSFLMGLHQCSELECSDKETTKSTSSTCCISESTSLRCTVLPEESEHSSARNRNDSSNVKTGCISSNVKLHIPDTSAPYSEELDLFLQDLDNELIFSDTSLIPEISVASSTRQPTSICPTHNLVSVSQHLPEIFPQSKKIKPQLHTVRTCGSPVTRLAEVHTPEASHLTSGSVGMLANCVDKRQLDGIMNTGITRIQPSPYSESEGKQHSSILTKNLQHKSCSGDVLCTEKNCSDEALLMTAALCSSNTSRDLFDESDDMFQDSYSSAFVNEEKSSTVICSPLSAVSPDNKLVNDESKDRLKKSLISSPLVMLPSRLWHHVIVSQQHDHRRMCTVHGAETSAVKTSNTSLQPVSSTPKINWLTTNRFASQLNESANVESYRSLTGSQDLFDESSHSSHNCEYTNNPIALSRSMSRTVQSTLCLPVIITGPKYSLNQLSFKDCTETSVQEKLIYTSSSSSSNDDLDRSRIRSDSEVFFSEEKYQTDTINETMFSSSTESVDSISHITDESKDLFDDS